MYFCGKYKSMKKLISLLLLIPLLLSCKSNEDKVNELIRNHMFQTLYDYQSYEPILTEIMEVEYAPENSADYIKFIKLFTEAKNDGLLDDKLERKAEDASNGILTLMDSLGNADDLYGTSMGYKVTHKFRCKSRDGVFDLVTKRFLVDNEMKSIIWEYTVDEGNSVDKNILSFLVKWQRYKIKMERFADYKRENIKFMQENRNEEGVVSLPSGLQYKVLHEGKGRVPIKTDRVKIHYINKTIEGTLIDNTIERGKPFETQVDWLVKGLVEALTIMPVGSKWMVYVPYELGYGDRDMGLIKPYSTLIMEVHLLEIEK